MRDRIVHTDSYCRRGSAVGHRHSWVAEVRQLNRRVSGHQSLLHTPVRRPTNSRLPRLLRHSDSIKVLRSAGGRRRPGRSRWRRDRLVDVRRCRWDTAESLVARCRSRHSRSSLDVVPRSRRRCQDSEPASTRTNCCL